MIFLQLFGIFFLIGICTFGGGYAMIPLIQDFVVDRMHWIDTSTLTDFIAVSESTPGPFAVNISTFIGYRMGGVLGSICSTIGVVLPSLIIIIIVAMILTKFMKNKYVKGALNGVKPIVVALILSVTLVLAIKIIFFSNGSLYNNFAFDKTSLALVIILLSFALIFKKIKKKSLSPIAILLASALLGIIIFLK